jgi:hypothetical protein
MEFEGHKQLNDFSEAVGQHHTTINNWFNNLEQKRIHYVNRTLGKKERVFDAIDFHLAKYIQAKRAEKWSMEGIFNHLPNQEVIELRPFPPEYEGEVTTQVALFEQLRNRMGEDIREELTLAIQKLTSEMQTMLPVPEDPNAERDRYVTRYLTERRIEAKLEEEAIELWSKLPDSERTRKKGLFGREEDPIKRLEFIRQYVRKHQADRFLTELDIDPK